MWKFYSCDWFEKGWQNRVVRYNTMRELLTANRGYVNWAGQHHRDNRIDTLVGIVTGVAGLILSIIALVK